MSYNTQTSIDTLGLETHLSHRNLSLLHSAQDKPVLFFLLSDTFVLNARTEVVKLPMDPFSLALGVLTVVETSAKAAETLVSLLDAKQLALLSYHIDAPEWRTWSNPEFLLSDKGIRLDEVTPQVRQAVMAVVEAA